MLKGIGNDSVCSSTQILTKVTINDFILEMLFHVILDKYLKHDIMIGREIWIQGFEMTIESDRFCIYKVKLINVVTEPKTYEDCINENVELNEADKGRLIKVLKPYMEHFISGVPKSQVNTGQLEIRLIDPNKTVQRRPYRLR